MENQPTQSLDKTASWVIVDGKNKAVFETFTKSLAEKINTKKYRVVPILEYLQSLNGVQS